MKNKLSIENNQNLLSKRQKSLLKSGSTLTKDDEESFLERARLEPAFLGIIPLRCKAGEYYFLNLDDDGVADYLFWFGSFGYERVSAVLFTHLAVKASFVMDLGSYSGYYSLLSSILAKNPNTYAVEANPLNFHRLCENLRLNGSEATSYNYALTPLNENANTVTIFYNKDLRVLDTGSFVSTDIAETLPQKSNKKDAFIVPTITLFSLMEKIATPLMNENRSYILVKLDVEGLEIPLLTDIFNLFSNKKIIVFVEILTATSYQSMLSLIDSRNDLSIAYIDEYAQKFILQINLQYTRQKGSRNFIVGNSELIQQICELSPSELLGQYE